MADRYNPALDDIQDTPEDAVYRQHIQPAMEQAGFKRQGLPSGRPSTYDHYHTETGHVIDFGVPSMHADANWTADISHPASKQSWLQEHGGATTIASHRVNLGTDAAYAPQRLQEFMKGRHGLAVMQTLAQGTYRRKR